MNLYQNEVPYEQIQYDGQHWKQGERWQKKRIRKHLLPLKYN